MIEEQARVIAVGDEMVEITTLRHSACGACDAKAGCGTSLLASWFPQRQLRFRVRNHIGAQPGDTVIVGLDERGLQHASFLLYGMPLLGLIGGAVIGEQTAISMSVSSELGAVGGGLLGLIAALLFVKSLTENRLAGGDSSVRLLRVACRSQTLPLPGSMAAEQPEVIRKVE